MKKIAHLILAVSLVLSFSSFVYADEYPNQFRLIGREVSPGFDLGNITVGALFIGEFFYLDSNGNWNKKGRFGLILDHDGKNIEVCNEVTRLIRSKLIMNFYDGGRLVLVGPIPSDRPVDAQWDYDDPDCLTGDCILLDYTHYIGLLFGGVGSLSGCADETNPYNAFIAEVPQFGLVKQRFGSYGTSYTGGSVLGWLVHTPIVSPAIFGTVFLDE